MNARSAMKLVLALIACCAPAVSLAADVRPVFVAGYDTGGDKLVTVTFTNGDTQSIRANEGFTPAAACRSSTTTRTSSSWRR